MPGERIAVAVSERVDALALLLEVVDACVDAVAGTLQQRGQRWPDQPGVVIAVLGELLNLGFGKSQVAQTAHDTHAPQGVLIEESISGGAAAAGVDQAQVVLSPQHFDRHPGRAGQITDRHCGPLGHQNSVGGDGVWT